MHLSRALLIRARIHLYYMYGLRLQLRRGSAVRCQWTCALGFSSLSSERRCSAVRTSSISSIFLLHFLSRSSSPLRSCCLPFLAVSRSSSCSLSSCAAGVSRRRRCTWSKRKLRCIIKTDFAKFVGFSTCWFSMRAGGISTSVRVDGWELCRAYWNSWSPAGTEMTWKNVIIYIFWDVGFLSVRCTFRN